MQRARLSKLALVTAVGAVACGLSPAVCLAQTYTVPSTNLQPYNIVDKDGQCLTIDITRSSYWPLYTAPCGDPTKPQTFYFLNSDVDTDALIQEIGKPTDPFTVVRIARTDTFDNPLAMRYNLISADAASHTAYATTFSAYDWQFALFGLYRPQHRQVTTWTPVASVNSLFWYTGERTFRYGPGLDGTYATNTMQALSSYGGYGWAVCTGAFFPNSPARGPSTRCEMQGAVKTHGSTDSYTPFQTQLYSMKSPSCLNKVGANSVALGDCPATPANVWTLRPTSYPLYPL